ncbi:RES family NAD+ phosphorylase [Devosia sp. BK]|uniref:RES family NAD+ phosphorylase n=1 Tax=Devosia sp. BK TaxID=2871706 RepID=UPI00293A8A15|nr:RES family NAD+ phosphorylase [Devosia sp. BK]MDV3253476.1 RES family NAD+ phosphorylase [Devosia sp. BK]
MRFVGTCYRAHDPRWSFKPSSGEGAAIRGARFNPKGVPALYLGLSIMTAIKEISQGLPHRLDPTVLCSYDVDCEDVIDLTTERGRGAASVSASEMAGDWAWALAVGERPASWAIYDRLVSQGAAGIVVPSYAVGADANDRNLVLWEWGSALPHLVEVFDPSGRLPRDQLSWS